MLCIATTTTYYRARKLVRDELIPGTLNVGHCLPTITQAFIGIAVIQVDPLTLILMIVTAVAGAWLGAGVVSRLPGGPSRWGWARISDDRRG